MAGFVDRIKIVFDVDNSPAAQGFRGIRSEIASTDGAFNKFKVGAKGAFDTLGVVGPQAAMAAGAALVTFGAKAVGAFTDAALEAGKFADATGLTAEEASRLIEVASDLGIEAGTLEGAIRRVNGAAGTGALAEFGVEIAKTKDGAYDATGTFLNTVEAIGRITSASEREVAAKKLMGKSWAELAELTTMSADEMREAMAAVSDQQVFDDAEVQQARDYRAAMDELKDAVDKVTLAAGKGLTPVITDLAEGVGSLTDALGGGGAGAIGTMGDFVNPLDNVAGSFKELTTGTLTFGEVARSFFSWVPGFGEALDRWTDKNERLNGVVGYVSEALADQESQTEDTAEATESAAEQSKVAAETTGEYTSSIEDLADALDEARKAEEDAAGQRRSLADLNREVAAETDAYQDALVDLAGATMDQSTSAEDLEDKTRAAADAAISLAKSQAEQKAASGDARGENDLLIEALSETAATLAPGSPLRAQLDAYIAALRSIPRVVPTTLTITQEGVVVFPGGSDARKLDIGGATMGNTALAQMGVDALLGAQQARGDQPTKAERKRAEFDRELELLKRRYEVGDLAADEYLAALQRLGRKYKWRRLSDPWMTLFREIQKAKADVRDANHYEGGGGLGKNTKPGVMQAEDGSIVPGDFYDTPAPGVTKGGRAPAPRAGGTVVHIHAPNALVVDEKALDRWAARMEPAITKANRRRERGQG